MELRRVRVLLDSDPPSYGRCRPAACGPATDKPHQTRSLAGMCAAAADQKWARAEREELLSPALWLPRAEATDEGDLGGGRERHGGMALLLAAAALRSRQRAVRDQRHATRSANWDGGTDPDQSVAHIWLAGFDCVPRARSSTPMADNGRGSKIDSEPSRPKAHCQRIRNTMTAPATRSWPSASRSLRLLRVEDCACCASRIDRRLGTLRPTKKRPPQAFALSRA